MHDEFLAKSLGGKTLRCGRSLPRIIRKVSPPQSSAGWVLQAQCPKRLLKDMPL